MPAQKRTKRGGRFTEPTLPANPVVSERGVVIRYYLGTTGGRIEHGPPHLHVTGRGPSTRIGQLGRPIAGEPELSAAQADVTRRHQRLIRRAVRKIARWHFFETL